MSVRPGRTVRSRDERPTFQILVLPAHGPRADLLVDDVDAGEAAVDTDTGHCGGLS